MDVVLKFANQDINEVWFLSQYIEVILFRLCLLFTIFYLSTHLKYLSKVTWNISESIEVIKYLICWLIWPVSLSSFSRFFRCGNVAQSCQNLA